MSAANDHASRLREASVPRSFVQLNDAPPADSAPCGAVLPLHVCTRERGHDGAHVAHELVHPRRPVAVWWDDEPADAPTTRENAAFGELVDVLVDAIDDVATARAGKGPSIGHAREDLRGAIDRLVERLRGAR